MAAPMSAKRLLMVGAFVAVVVAMLAAHPAEASSFTFYSGSCGGSSAILNACGCNTVPSNTHGGYRFNYINGRSAAAYNGAGYTGLSSTRFQGSGTGQCTPVGWQSVFIQC